MYDFASPYELKDLCNEFLTPKAFSEANAQLENMPNELGVMTA